MTHVDAHFPPSRTDAGPGRARLLGFGVLCWVAAAVLVVLLETLTGSAAGAAAPDAVDAVIDLAGPTVDDAPNPTIESTDGLSPRRAATPLESISAPAPADTLPGPVHGTTGSVKDAAPIAHTGSAADPTLSPPELAPAPIDPILDATDTAGAAGTVDDVSGSLVDPVLAATDPVLDATDRALDATDPVVERAESTRDTVVQITDPAVAQVEDATTNVVDRVRGTVDQVLDQAGPATDPLGPVMDAFGPSVEQIETILEPTLPILGPTHRSVDRAARTLTGVAPAAITPTTATPATALSATVPARLSPADLAAPGAAGGSDPAAEVGRMSDLGPMTTVPGVMRPAPSPAPVAPSGPIRSTPAVPAATPSSPGAAGDPLAAHPTRCEPARNDGASTWTAAASAALSSVTFAPSSRPG